VALCRFCVNGRFGGTYRLHLQNRKFRERGISVSRWLQTEPDDKKFIFQLNTCGYGPFVISSMTRGWVCRLQLPLVLASAVILGFDYRRNRDHILLFQIRDSPNLEGQVPIFISPRNRVAQLYLQALGSLFVAAYSSQGSGGCIRPSPHTR
jgi:hypothetical protein